MCERTTHGGILVKLRMCPLLMEMESEGKVRPEAREEELTKAAEMDLRH